MGSVVWSTEAKCQTVPNLGGCLTNNAPQYPYWKSRMDTSVTVSAPSEAMIGSYPSFTAYEAAHAAVYENGGECIDTVRVL